MAKSFSIHSAHSGNRIDFEAIDPFKDRCLVRMVSEGLIAEAIVYDGGYAIPDLPVLLREMAVDWKGWQGRKTWTAVEGDLSLQFTSDKTGHISVEIEFSSDPGSTENWRVSTRLVLEFGMLAELANAADRFIIRGD